jgi:mono/diheme cytochrome c family protein
MKSVRSATDGPLCGFLSCGEQTNRELVPPRVAHHRASLDDSATARRSSSADGLQGTFVHCSPRAQHLQSSVDYHVRQFARATVWVAGYRISLPSPPGSRAWKGKDMIRAVSVAFLAIAMGIYASSAGESGGGPPPVDDATFGAGRTIFEAQCAVCHQATGSGIPPAIPALAGNENLQHVRLILETVRGGRDGMPPFPQLGVEELTAITSYIRNAWDNEFGGVSDHEVAEFLSETADLATPMATQSVWDGVYTEAQAEQGREVNERHCAECHGSGLRGGQFGGAPLAGRFFLHRWGDQSLQALYEYARTNMPPGMAGRLSNREYLQVVAFILEANDFPPGGTALEVADLPNIIIQSEPSE